jgi:hypothetical protein
VNLAGFLQLGLGILRPLLGKVLLAPLGKFSSHGQLQLQIVRLSLEESGDDFVKPGSHFNDRLPRFVTVGALERSAELGQCDILAPVERVSRPEL